MLMQPQWEAVQVFRDRPVTGRGNIINIMDPEKIGRFQQQPQP
jgi:hypothetical protein